MEQVRSTGSHSIAFVLLVLVMLAGLPVAVWLDLRNLSETSLLRQAKDLDSVVSNVRGYYASNVIGRVLASPGSTQVVHNLPERPGRHTDPRHTFARVRAGHQRAAGEHLLPVRLGFSVQKPCAARA